MNRISPVAALLLVWAFTACDDAGTPLLEPDSAVPLIEDGRDNGFGVYLNPPIGQGGYTMQAPHDPTSDPRVEICRLEVTDAGGDGIDEADVEAASCEDGPVLWSETDASSAGLPLVVSETDQFSLGWNTDAADAGNFFRVSILLPEMDVVGGVVELEYEVKARADVALYDNSSTKLDPSLVAGFTAGKAFPLKFAVEEGSGCDGLDCFAYRVTCLPAVHQTEHAGVMLPEDWAYECDTSTIGQEERNWWLFQERLPEGSPCIDSSEFSGILFDPCYVWQLVEEIDTGDATQLVPYIQEFRYPVTIQFCRDANPAWANEVPHALEDYAGIFRQSIIPGPPGFEVALVPGAAADALTDFSCPYVPGSAQNQFGFYDQYISPIFARIGLEPTPLYAGDGGLLSGRTVRTSDFQRGVELYLSFNGGSSTFSALTGSSTDLEVWLSSPPHEEPLDDPAVGLPGVDVQYTVISGDATLSGGTPCSAGATDCVLVVTTDPADPLGAGYAIATVTLGDTETPVVIEVTVPDDPDFQGIQYTIQPIQLDLIFLEPLGTGGGETDATFPPTIYICDNNTTGCDAGTAHAVIQTSDIKLVTDNTGRKFYQADWKPKNTGATVDASYYVQVLANGSTTGFSPEIHVIKGGRSEYIEPIYYLGENGTLAIKFIWERP
jgi:hypothetical protein